MDIVKEMGELQMRIILVSAFGLTNLNHVRLPYEQNGLVKEYSIDQYLRKCTSFMLFRAGRKIFSIIPYLMFFYYSAADREYKRNIKCIRDFCEKIIEERKNQLNGPEKDKFVNNPDLLTILLSDDLFKNNNKAMIDEIITFFLAGSFTLRSVNSNMLMYLGMNPDVNRKLMKELIDTHLRDFVNDSKPVDTENVYTFESIENLKYFVNCFYESLRIEPPTVASGGVYTED
jgi:cytochrome P450